MLPDYQTLMLPVLRCGSEGETSVRACIERLKAEFSMSDAEAAELLPSGRETKIRNRTAWAITYLVEAGLLERPRRGFFRATAEGRQVLAQAPDRIDVAYLKRFPSFLAFQNRRNDSETAVTGAVLPIPVASGEVVFEPATKTPEERIEEAEAEIAAQLAQDLLARIVAGSPTAFEQLIVELLLRMGYGGSRREAGLRVGGTGDGGIDGVINEDPLGLDVVYLQAKRYAADRSISGEAVRGFAGALLTKGASKGVFVTTSRFTKDAVEAASSVKPQRIVLVDGERLTALMIKHGIGVRTERIVELKRIDLDFFEPDTE